MLLPNIKGSNIVYPKRKYKDVPLASETLASIPKLSGNISTKIAGYNPIKSTSTKKKPNFNSLIPYASNIVNGFRRLPNPIASQMESSISPSLVNYDTARNAIDVDQRNLNRETDYKVANPTIAQSIKAATLGKVIGGKNALYQEEANQNANINNQTAQFNQGVQARNIGRQNEFNQNLVGRNIAQQNLLSENLANIGDKYQEQTKDKSLMELENRKLSYLPEFYEKNGVDSSPYDRFLKRNSQGQEEEYKELGGSFKPIPKTPNELIKERTQKRDSVRNVLNTKFPKNYKKVNNGMLEYMQAEPDQYKDIKLYGIGGTVDPNKPAKLSSNDFQLIPWSKQGVQDSTGKAPFYKTSFRALNQLRGQQTPQGINPNEETYSQIDSLQGKLASFNGAKPVTSFAKDIYGNPVTTNQGRNVGTFAKGGTIHIKPSHRGLLHKNLGVKEGHKIPASKLIIHSGDSTALKKRKVFAQNAKHWHKG